MKTQELRQMSEEELDAKIREETNRLFEMKFRNRRGEIKNPLQIRILRRELARMKTILRQDRDNASEIKSE